LFIMCLTVFNSMTRRKEKFIPLVKNKVKYYSCGPTVYDYAHIGNFRAYIFEDLLRRVINYKGCRVTQVMNLTDVDDKTIKGSHAAKLSLDNYTGKYKKAFFEDIKTLNIQPAEHYPEATKHINDMIELIKKLFAGNMCYQADDGSVYFNIRKFQDYGKLSHLDIHNLRIGARINQDEYQKEYAADFALWKAWNKQDGDIYWNSPWGKGRPGWHIECSAMSMKYLGESFDLHTGGIDNMFPHHEDEIAQSEAATGKKFVKYWMHCEHLIVNNQKMSKSLGNFYTLRDLISKGYTGREVRYVLLSAHYRQQLNFTLDALSAAKNALYRIDKFIDRIQQVSSQKENQSENRRNWTKPFMEEFDKAVSDDLNIPLALGEVFNMIREGNRMLDQKSLSTEQALQGIICLNKMDAVLGLLPGKEEKKPGKEIYVLAEKRQKAREKKEWTTADELRNLVLQKGWNILDTPSGFKLEKK
jgi:cysteinyl-tRNA synthetase